MDSAALSAFHAFSAGVVFGSIFHVDGAAMIAIGVALMVANAALALVYLSRALSGDR